MKSPFLFLVPLSLILASCANENSFNASSYPSSGSSFPNSDSPSSSDIFEPQPDSSFSYSSEKEKDLVEVSGPITLDKDDVIDFSKASYKKNNFEFAFTRAKKNANGFISLEKGGCFT